MNENSVIILISNTTN